MKQTKLFIQTSLILYGFLLSVSGNVLAEESFSNRSLNLRISAGSSFQVKNDVQIPNTDFGTRFSLAETAGEGPVPAVRIEANWMLNKKHGIRLLMAPLTYTEPVMFDQPIQFAGASFAQGQLTDASYRFNSWRIGYHYTLKDNPQFLFRVGGTLKVRDAEIRLEQGNTKAFDDDLGLVPLLYLSAKRSFGNRWTFGADLDGLAGGPGRAIDAGITLDFSITKRWKLGADARVLEGGADIEQVYNFAQLNSFAIALSADF